MLSGFVQFLFLYKAYSYSTDIYCCLIFIALSVFNDSKVLLKISKNIRIYYHLSVW